MNFTASARTAAIAAVATLNALAILAFAPKSHREKEIARAKRNVAERKAQIAARHPAPIAPTAPAETENPIAVAPVAFCTILHNFAQPAETENPIAVAPDSAPAAKTAPTLLPALPDPWTTAPTAPAPTAPAPTAPIAPPAAQPQLCLTPAPEPAPTEPAPKPKRAIAPKNLNRLTIRELKAIAAKRKIRGAAKMNKSQLIAALA